MWAQQEQRSPARIVSGAGSLKSPGNQGHRIGEGWDRFFSKVAKSLEGSRVEMLLELHFNDLPSVPMSLKAESTPTSENMMCTYYRI